MAATVNFAVQIKVAQYWYNTLKHAEMALLFEIGVTLV